MQGDITPATRLQRTRELRRVSGIDRQKKGTESCYLREGLTVTGVRKEKRRESDRDALRSRIQ